VVKKFPLETKKSRHRLCPIDRAKKMVEFEGILGNEWVQFVECGGGNVD